MLHIELWKRVLIWGFCFVGLLFASPNLFYERIESINQATKLKDIAAASEAPQSPWLSYLPTNLVRLGLDLRGGAHLLAEVQVDDVYSARMKSLWPDVKKVLREERSVVGTIRKQPSPPDELWIKLSQPEGLGRAEELVRNLSQSNSLFGVSERDLNISSSQDLLVIKLSEAERRATDQRTLRQALEIIRRRIDEVGTREPTIQRQGNKRILIQVPGLTSADELKDLIGTTAQLTFQPVISTTQNSGKDPGSGNELLASIDDSDPYYILEQAAVVSGEDLVDAQPSFDQNGRPAVTFRFNPSGARRFGDYTAQNIGEPFAIVLDGKVISAPVIQSHISGGSGIITGKFSIEESTELAVLLRAGALPAALTFLEERTIGPELGADSVEAGKIACVVAFVGILFFMILSYGTFGVFANIALIINIGLIFGLLSLLGATLTLPGIAGIVLTIGMAVDANVLVFERIREEIKTAKGPAKAIELGYEKALSAILDANVTTFITAIILYAFGSGPVRGFSITLGLGIITSVFTSIYVTRLIIVIWLARRTRKKLEL